MSVTHRYCICSVPRSGSSMLCSALRATEVAGRPAEHFLDWRFKQLIRPAHEISWLNRLRFELLTLRKKNYKFFQKYPQALAPYAQALLRTQSPNGVYGVKIHHMQYLQSIHPLRIDELFGPMKYIVITRRDRVRQAVSWARAEQTSRWFFGSTETAEPKYDFARIVHAHALICNEERQWNQYLQELEIEPLRLVYEDLVENYTSTMLEILSFIGIATSSLASIKPPELRKQSDDLNSVWADQYCRDLKKLAEDVSFGAVVPDVRELLQDAA